MRPPGSPVPIPAHQAHQRRRSIAARPVPAPNIVPDLPRPSACRCRPGRRSRYHAPHKTRPQPRAVGTCRPSGTAGRQADQAAAARSAWGLARPIIRHLRCVAGQNRAAVRPVSTAPRAYRSDSHSQYTETVGLDLRRHRYRDATEAAPGWHGADDTGSARSAHNGCWGHTAPNRRAVPDAKARLWRLRGKAAFATCNPTARPTDTRWLTSSRAG